ncbi:MAG: hypothetical protein KBS47_02995 [Bacteroidales bacterium]|nr:hypothetical protein [Candidatus Equimonas enterica]
MKKILVLAAIALCFVSCKDSNDSLLDSYEEVAEQVVSCTQKAKSGDPEAISETATLMEKGKELDLKIANAKGSFTPEQNARYLQISQKMMMGAFAN